MELPSNHQPTPTPATAASELRLRPFTLSDAAALFSWASDHRVTRFQRRHPYTNLSESTAYITRHILPHPWYRAICLSDRPIGSISVTPSTNYRRAALGYRLKFECWGKGIATMAVRKAVETVFGDMPQLERLEAVVDVENLGSGRVLEKVAVMRRYICLKGEMRDMVMYSVLATDVK